MRASTRRTFVLCKEELSTEQRLVYALENRARELKKRSWCIQALHGMSLVEVERAKNMSTYDETVCGTARNEGRLNSTKIKCNIGDLFDDIPVLVALIVIIGVKRIYLAESRCKSLLRTHGGGSCGSRGKPDSARKSRSLSSCFQL
jgi:hypothetical protein